MNIKVSKKMARLLGLRIQLKEIISIKQVSYYHLLKEKAVPRQPFLFIFKIQRYLVFLEKE